METVNLQGILPSLLTISNIPYLRFCLMSIIGINLFLIYLPLFHWTQILMFFMISSPSFLSLDDTSKASILCQHIAVSPNATMAMPPWQSCKSAIRYWVVAQTAEPCTGKVMVRYVLAFYDDEAFGKVGRRQNWVRRIGPKRRRADMVTEADTMSYAPSWATNWNDPINTVASISVPLFLTAAPRLRIELPVC